MTSLFKSWCVAAAMLVGASWVQAQTAAQSCATPGFDGIAFSAPSYYPGQATANAGQNQVTIGAIRATAAGDYGGAPGATPISAGDLVMVIQMQDASYNNANSTAYGANNGTGRGYTSLNNTGKFEFKRVRSVAGAVLTLDSNLTYTYTRSGATSATSGNRRFQVIRVPQFSAVSLPGGTVQPPHWNGETGGVWAIDVVGNLNLNNTTVSANGLGFRGGAGFPQTQVNGRTDYVDDLNLPVGGLQAGEACPGGSNTPNTNQNFGAMKGEGFAGTPRFVRNQNPPAAAGFARAYPVVDLGVSGYANNQDLARGAPGNAGGGGTQHNAGGGGGSNVGLGGTGGNSFAFYNNPGQGACVAFTGGSPNPFNACGGDNARAVGGLGGGTVTASIENLVMGGGGGAGESNNACDNQGTPQAGGGNGGGIIFIRAGTVSGTGNLQANGQAGLPGGRDAAGGGGAGGSVVILSGTTNPSLNIQVNGGAGGNTGHAGSGGVAGAFLVGGETQGPAGGGGGGAVIISSNITGLPAPQLGGGASGRTFPTNGNTAGVNNAYGAAGGGGLASTVPFSPAPRTLASQCLPNLSVSKSTTTPTRTEGLDTTVAYVISVVNNGTGSAAGVTVQDTLQTPLVYAGTPAVAALQTGSPTSAGPTPLTGTGTSTFLLGTPGSSTNSYYIEPGARVTLTVVVSLNGATPTGNPYQNSVTVAYLDPTRTSGTTTVSPGGAYQGGGTAPGSNYAATSSAQEDVSIVRAVNLQITKTNGVITPTGLVAGGTTAYTITVANFGPSPADGSVVSDPVTAGLQCTTVSCAQFGAAQCPAPGPGPVNLTSFQTSGVAIPALPASAVASLPANRLEFRVVCNVTATGQ